MKPHVGQVGIVTSWSSDYCPYTTIPAWGVRHPRDEGNTAWFYPTELLQIVHMRDIIGVHETAILLRARLGLPRELVHAILWVPWRAFLARHREGRFTGAKEYTDLQWLLAYRRMS